MCTVLIPTHRILWAGILEEVFLVRQFTNLDPSVQSSLDRYMEDPNIITQNWSEYVITKACYVHKLSQSYILANFQLSSFKSLYNAQKAWE